MGCKMIVVPLTFTLPVMAQGQHPHTRSGFWFSGGVGIGHPGSNESLTIALGTTLGQRVLAGAGLNAWNDQDIMVYTGTAQIRFYPSEASGFYLLGGLGYGSSSLLFAGVVPLESGIALTAGLGIDYRVMRNLSLTSFWYGNSITISGVGRNFGIIGLGITVH